MSTAYNQWTQFEEFPRFMDGVREVRQIDERHLRWRASVGGHEKEWDAEIREQVPDQVVIWRATSGAENAGMVKFDALGADRTRVHLEMSYDPEGFSETVGDALGFMSRRVQGDLERFRDLIESRGVETGAWRGQIANPDAPGGHTRGSLDAGEPGRSKGDQIQPGTRIMAADKADWERERDAAGPSALGDTHADTGMSHGAGAGYDR